jgi:hypothetical protein
MRRIEAHGPEPIPSNLKVLEDPLKVKQQHHKMYNKNISCKSQTIEIE